MNASAHPPDYPERPTDLWTIAQTPVTVGAPGYDLESSSSRDDPRLQRPGWSKAAHWSVCSACESRIEQGDTQAIAELPASGRRWVHGDCADDDLAGPQVAPQELHRAGNTAAETPAPTDAATPIVTC